MTFVRSNSVLLSKKFFFASLSSFFSFQEPTLLEFLQGTCELYRWNGWNYD